MTKVFIRLCKVYTLDGLKEGVARVEPHGPAKVETLDGRMCMRVPRAVALHKLATGAEFYAC